MDLHTFLRKIPKVELHVHYGGTVKLSTFIQLATEHGVKLPAYDQPEELYQRGDIYRLLRIYILICAAIQERDDFRRVAYETMQEAADNRVRYREMFWSPTVHMEQAGVSYDTAVDGIIDGLIDAETDFGVHGRLIADINRQDTPENAYELIELLLEHPRDEVIGIGLDFAERDDPPEKFWKAYRLAGQHGFHLTAHACEDAPARNVETCLDLLGCERIDHGYYVLQDQHLTQRCVNEGIVFTVVPHASNFIHIEESSPEHPIKRMAERGLEDHAQH